MYKFSDINFVKYTDPEGIKGRINFKNGYTASVVKTESSYGGSEGLYELAILKDNHMCYTTPITNDVLGYLSEEEVTNILNQIDNLPNIES